MKHKTYLWLGAALVILGALAMASALGAQWASMEKLWPVVVMVGGGAAIADGIRQRKQDGLWLGLTLLLGGGLLAYVTLYAGWPAIARLWPLLIAFAGAGWLGAWLLDRSRWANLVLAAAALLVCLAVLGLRSGQLPQPLQRVVVVGWPWLLVVLGIALVVEGARTWRTDADRD
ncbi:MAG: hypothetical protein GXY68_13830 [Chloroflexi bacterium]|jgi:hypothetical protein|nr:hypothetical protein [Chloroflexota bacterium]